MRFLNLLLPLPELLELDDRLLLTLDRLLEDFRVDVLLEVRGLDLSSDPFLLWDLLEG